MNDLLIETERLHIRKLKLSDIDDFYVYRSNPEVTRYQGFDVMTKEQCLDFINSQQNKILGEPGAWIYYGIENRSTKKLIGDCAIMFHADDPRIAESGITISHLHQKQGYSKEGLIGIFDFLFHTQNVWRILEFADTENISSYKVLESIGFRREGHFIENVWFKGKWASEYQYAMLKREWDNL